MTVQFKICNSLADFQSKISSVSENAIVFIVSEKLIWTQGQYYYCSEQLASRLSKGLMSPEDKIKLDDIDLNNLVTADVLNDRLNGYSIQVVEALPESPATNVIYMVV